MLQKRPMDQSLRRLVFERAKDSCEYCQLARNLSSGPFEVDHIIAKQHGGHTVSENLALSCLSCNSHKGPNLSGIDPETGKMVRLFHPRNDRWADHFQWDGPFLRGCSPVGRATIAVLAINAPDAVAEREMVREIGKFPPR